MTATPPSEAAFESALTHAPWTLPVEACSFAYLDCEMTGDDPTRDALVEVAVLRVEAGVVVDAFESLVRSEVPICEKARALHGIDDAAVAGAPTFADVAPRLDALLAGAVPVAHGAAHDVIMLERAFAAVGFSRRVEPCLDTLTLARRALHAKTYTLSSVAARFGVTGFRWHRAGEDARAVAAIFAPLAAMFRPSSACDLWEVRAGQRGSLRVRASLDALFTRVAGTRRPLTLHLRTPGRDATTIVACVERWTRPHLLLAPGVRGSASGFRGLRLLRADRVLYATER